MPRIDVHFTVTEQVLRQYPPTLLRAGDKNYFYATFDVCEKWADVAELRAVFERSDLERPYVQDLVQDNGCYECVIPWEVMQTPGLVRVGVFGGDRILTNKVEVSVSVGCRCDGDAPRSPTRDWFLRIEELIQELGTPGPEAIASVVAEYIAANPIEEKDPTVPSWAKADKKPEYSADEVGAIAKTELHTAINTALAQAKESGEFDGAQGPKGEPGPAGSDGKSAYAYAVEGGYTGTKEEFAVKLAKEKFANPNALTFTGAVTGSYDGAEPLTVNIPSSGGGSGGGEAEFPNWRLIKTISFSADIGFVEFNTDDDGNTFSLKEIMLAGTLPAYSGYIYMKPTPTGFQNSIWPTASKDIRWWSASVNGKLKTMLAVSNASVIWPVDKDPVCENDTISKLVIGASAGFTADGTMYVYGR